MIINSINITFDNKAIIENKVPIAKINITICKVKSALENTIRSTMSISKTIKNVKGESEIINPATKESNKIISSIKEVNTMGDRKLDLDFTFNLRFMIN